MKKALDLKLWTNVAFFLIAGYYLVYTIWVTRERGFFESLGIDYRVYRASAEIANSRGFAKIYTPRVQDRFQAPLYDSYSFGTDRAPYFPIPQNKFPIFILPLQALLILEPVPSFMAWTLVNITLLIFYLHRFLSSLGIAPKATLILKAMLAYPIFSSLFNGQIDAWLLLFLGEFILAQLHNHEFRGGLWLGATLLKAPILIIILPGLLLARKWKTLVGFGAMTTIILTVSLSLSGPEALNRLFNQILSDIVEEPPELIARMMNWRMLTIGLPTPELSWGLALLAMLGTTVLALYLWLRPINTALQFIVLILGALAATFTVSPHAYTYFALPIVAPILYLRAKGILPDTVFNLWLLLPGLISIPTRILDTGAIYPRPGLIIFMFNIAFLLWSAKTLGWGRATQALVT